jgi:hypothetical protein
MYKINMSEFVKILCEKINSKKGDGFVEQMLSSDSSFLKINSTKYYPQQPIIILRKNANNISIFIRSRFYPSHFEAEVKKKFMTNTLELIALKRENKLDEIYEILSNKIVGKIETTLSTFDYEFELAKSLNDSFIDSRNIQENFLKGLNEKAVIDGVDKIMVSDNRRSVRFDEINGIVDIYSSITTANLKKEKDLLNVSMNLYFTIENDLIGKMSENNFIKDLLCAFYEKLKEQKL